jgi:hypothetical protein
MGSTPPEHCLLSAQQSHSSLRLGNTFSALEERFFLIIAEEVSTIASNTGRTGIARGGRKK